MAEITIHVDSQTLSELEAVASKNRLTVPKWIQNRILRELKPEWPKDYFSLFGALGDDDLIEPPEISFEHDAPRERL